MAINDTRHSDVELLMEPANEAARLTRNVYLTYLLVWLYIFIIVSGTRDLQLLREEPVALPLFNVRLPLLGFHSLVPWLFVALHGNLLLQLYLLAGKIHRLEQAIATLRTAAAREKHRLRVFPFLFSHMLMREQNSRFAHGLMETITLLTVIVLPVVLLVAAQVLFVRYQGAEIAWLQRGAVTADLVLLWMLWPLTVKPRGEVERWWLRIALMWGARRKAAGPARGASLLVTVSLSAWFVAWLLAVPITADSELSVADVRVSPSEGDERTWRDKLIRRHLVLRETNLTPGLTEEAVGDLRTGKQEQRKDILKKTSRLDLRKRSLRFADFHSSTLARADLRSADLQGADLGEAQLQGANLRFAQLQGADLKAAQLQGADLVGAQLQEADLVLARLQGVALRQAQLQGANLGQALLHGADLYMAQLQGATLYYAELQGANLGRAQLQGADLRYAVLQGATLSDAQVAGVYTEDTVFRFTDLRSISNNPLLQEKMDEILQSLPEAIRENVSLRLSRALDPPPLLEKVIITDSLCSDSLAGRPGCLPGGGLEPYYTGLFDVACHDAHIAKQVFRRARYGVSDLLIDTWLGQEECSAAKYLPENWREQLSERLNELHPAR